MLAGNGFYVSSFRLGEKSDSLPVTREQWKVVRNEQRVVMYEKRSSQAKACGYILFFNYSIKESKALVLISQDKGFVIFL